MQSKSFDDGVIGIPPVFERSDHIVSLLRLATTGRCSVIKFYYKARMISADDFDC
jgi:hypothetical protein